MTFVKRILLTFILVVAALVVAPLLHGQDAPQTEPDAEVDPAMGAQNVIIVLDASGSMWGQVMGEAKIEIARRVIRQLIEDFPEDINIGLLTYGHRTKGDCDDIELLIPAGPLEDREQFIKTVDEILPRGMTPLTNAVVQAAEHLKYEEESATVILISDGIETCDEDPCAVSEQLAATGVNFTAHVVGFDLTAEDARTIECIATNTGGRFLPARDAGSLKDALDVAMEEVTASRVPEPEPEPEPEEEPATLQAPAEVPAGSKFEVTWEGPDNKGDFITIVPKDAEENDYANFAYTRNGNPLELTALIEPQEAELRYLSGVTRKVLGRADILITPIQASLEAPDEAVAGARIKIEWTGPDNANDYITIVEEGAEEGTYNRYVRTRTGSPVTVEAPVDPGPHEIRYITGQGGKTLASRPITLTEADVTLQAPDEAVVGSKVKIEWTGPNNPSDYLTIVEEGVDEGTYNRYTRTSKESPLTVEAPMEPGPHEIRYVAGQGGATLASRPITLVEAEITLEAADEAVVGSKVKIEWTGPNNPSDYLTIVAEGADEGTYNRYTRTSKESPLTVEAPMDPGPHEIRYVAGQGGATLGSRPITLIEPEITLEAADEAVVGSKVKIEWTGPNNASDYLTIVAEGANEGTYNRYTRTGKDSPLTVEAPMEPGPHEIRYVAGQGGETLASRPITLLEPEITLEAADEAVVGSKVKIEWTGPNNPSDYLTIVAEGADEGTYNRYTRTGKDSPLTVEAPMEPGPHEIRYVAGQGGKTLASRPVTLLEPEITLEAPAETVVEQPIAVTWTGPDNSSDYLAIALKGSEPDDYQSYVRTSQGSPAKLKGPAEPGEYEIRYHAGQNKAVLHAIPITVIAGE